jgi:hypothetical protein
MNATFIASLLLRWLFLVPTIAGFFAALIFLPQAEVVVLVLAHTLPFSFIFFLGFCLFISLLVTLKSPELFQNRFDKYAVSAGILVILIWGISVLYSIFFSEPALRANYPTVRNDGVNFVHEQPPVYPPHVLEEWERGIWIQSNPACLRATDSSIDNNCPGSIDVTFCWEMDPSKDWGIKGDDCAQGMKSKRIFSRGITQYKVPWCRSFESECLASLKVIEAKALKFK